MAPIYSKFDLGYSKKNIPIPSQKEYRLQLRQTTPDQQKTTLKLNLHFTPTTSMHILCLFFLLILTISFKFSSNVICYVLLCIDPHFVSFFRREAHYVQGVASKQACKDISWVRYVLDVIICINK